MRAIIKHIKAFSFLGNPQRVSSALRAMLCAFPQRGYILRFVFFSYLISHISYLSAQISATFKGDSAKVEIGDHLNMRLVINARPNIMVDFPTFPGDSIGKIAIIRKDKIDTAALGGDTVFSQNIVISAYEEGRYFFSPMKIYFMDKTTRVIDSAYTNDWEMTVTTLPVDTTKPIKPIKAPLKVDYKLNEFTWWLVALAVLLAALIGIFIWYRYFRKKPLEVQARPRPKEPAHIWASKELKKLDSEKLWQGGEYKTYHSRLSDILRSYLEYRFNYYAMEATTEEILKEVNRFDTGMEANTRLMETLRLADFVKFAKMNPAPDQNMKSIQDALAFVELTKPKADETIDNKPINK